MSGRQRRDIELSDRGPYTSTVYRICGASGGNPSLEARRGSVPHAERRTRTCNLRVRRLTTGAGSIDDAQQIGVAAEQAELAEPVVASLSIRSEASSLRHCLGN
jgi:hypothetical protein